MGYAKISGYWADAQPVREHVRFLADNGISIKKVAQLSGYHTMRGMEHLLYGKHGLPPSRRIRRETAESILAIQPLLELCSPQSKIDGTITRRKLRAMMAMGWSIQSIGNALKKNQSNMWKLFTRETPVRASTALAIRDFFDANWDKRPPMTTANHRASFIRTLRYAEERGFVTAMAWNDIDDINERHPKRYALVDIQRGTRNAA